MVASQTLTVRPARMDDAAMLLAWRNDALTRQASHETEPVSEAAHVEWLRQVLISSDRRLLVIECDGVPVGTVRVDKESDGHVLSWTVAPASRGQGLGAAMVKLVSQGLTGPLRAEIKRGNDASVRIAEAAGLRLQGEREGILHYARPAIS